MFEYLLPNCDLKELKILEYNAILIGGYSIIHFGSFLLILKHFRNIQECACCHKRNSIRKSRQPFFNLALPRNCNYGLL